MSENREILRLLAIMAQLRDPQTGCEWDRVQTFDTIAPYTLEETYEVLDAIARKDFSALKEELGDLLYQVVFYARMAQEQQLFDFNDVCEAISNKLERRHPHIFAIENENNLATEKHRWEKIKAQEREAKAQYSLLDDIPATLPALMKAEKMQKRCASVGFDWHELSPVLDKVYEEIDEVMAEVKKAPRDDQRIEDELGDLLFSVVNLSRHLKQKPEQALNRACRKFEQRFRFVEKMLTEQGINIENASLEEMEIGWQKAKEKEIE
ncbi:TPA: nucleoside triphosphate pyrophosphohydrolase [Proteus mirabilis]|uniref:nucleoside triphosphate pyrophosphohydrolase n=1 Tax=Proteus mirabilis TaxID=584 RepID=UPI0013D7F5E8|nr:nucleoside triphosphate pyrophosphohydrolase [Proteus mirabilis]ELA7711543.1 nucleoside triphosphate pyrophosphohydrolase [Proteus mirabilis]ELA9917083.1 nucleoside triphosphate pyrophosphohydrolase [Proteus mirabilis]MBG2964187.1 nucleoside triphosphate pyrophosphohydrolase [Proteus mirabilis]MBG3040707.1 nucleoside triphosphate pyrophosphohydrolase [Proteus mirabilis]MBG3072535.1 nucleoside triphosphate pyrophosphohydrolase [Proteus mirabilis]